MIVRSIRNVNDFAKHSQLEFLLNVARTPEQHGPVAAARHASRIVDGEAVTQRLTSARREVYVIVMVLTSDCTSR